MTCRVVSGKSAAAFRLVVLLDGQSFLYRAWPSSENIFNIDIYITNSKVKSVVAYVHIYIYSSNAIHNNTLYIGMTQLV